MITKNKGLILVETLIYSVGVVLLVGAIVFILINVYGWYDKVTIISRTNQAGVTLVDRIMRDVRTGEIIGNAPQSVFDVSPGSLQIETKVNSSSITKKYAVSDSRITYAENAGAPTPISSVDIPVTKLVFKRLDTGISSAIRVELELTFSIRGATTTRMYSGVAIMKNSY